MSALPKTPARRLEIYEPEADLMVLHFGPQHPSTHGVFRMQLLLDGERIVQAIPDLGYLHRGVEKLCEQLTYAQVTPIVDKNDYVAPMTNEQAINMAYEKLLGVEVPRRGRWIRTLEAELQRIASHLLAVGTFMLDLGGALGGGSTVFLWCFREREAILDLFEDITGARFHYNTNTIGGVRHDIPAGWDAKAKAALAAIEEKLLEYEATATKNRIFEERTKGVGILEPELALSLGVTGPNLRASGVDHDLRRDAPYHCYDELEVRVPVWKGMDCYSRASIRIDEIRESIRLSRQLIDGVPEGPICGGRPIKLPGQFKSSGGQAYVGIETPRGELGTFVIGGGPDETKPFRCKIRPPSLHALSALPYMLVGETVSDAVAILGSLDPIMGEVDR